MTKFRKNLGLSTLVLGSAISATALAQAPAAPSNTASATSMNPDDPSTYATGKPLAGDSKEGFWGHMNPFARKKWVNRQVDPVKDRMNELDQLQAKNAGDIKDVDARSTAGINKAMMAANTADSHAADAAARANAAQGTATTASTRTDALNGTVSNLDQYQQVAEASVPFVAGRTTLGIKGKASLDDVAAKLTGEKGYIIEVQGYSKSGVQSSQAMADSVVRYLVTEHQVPIYRIYRTGLGKNTQKPTADEAVLINGVRVTLLHNSLATMGATATRGSVQAPASSTQSASLVQ